METFEVRMKIRAECESDAEELIQGYTGEETDVDIISIERKEVEENRCALCNYEIKDIKLTPKEELKRADYVAFEFRNNWLCGTCHDDLSEFLESEDGSPFVPYEPKTREISR